MYKKLEGHFVSCSFPDTRNQTNQTLVFFFQQPGTVLSFSKAVKELVVSIQSTLMTKLPLMHIATRQQLAEDGQ